MPSVDQYPLSGTKKYIVKIENNTPYRLELSLKDKSALDLLEFENTYIEANNATFIIMKTIHSPDIEYATAEILIRQETSNVLYAQAKITLAKDMFSLHYMEFNISNHLSKIKITADPKDGDMYHTSAGLIRLSAEN